MGAEGKNAAGEGGGRQRGKAQQKSTRDRPQKARRTPRSVGYASPLSFFRCPAMKFLVHEVIFLGVRSLSKHGEQLQPCRFDSRHRRRGATS